MARLSYHEHPKEEIHDDDATLDGGSDSEPDTDNEGAAEPATAPDPPESAGLKAAKAFGMGLACVVGIPVAAALVTVGGVVYGAGKVLEGVGRGLAAGPEAAFNAADPNQGTQNTTEAPKPKPKPKQKPTHKSKPKGPKPKSQ